MSAKRGGGTYLIALLCFSHIFQCVFFYETLRGAINQGAPLSVKGQGRLGTP